MSIPQASGTDSSNQQQHLYDVFLSHASADKPAVEALAVRLEDDEALKPFLDKWHLIPGEPWQEALEDALDQSKTCAVFLGPGALGPWENEEMRVSLDERVRNQSFRVIPVLLPGAEPKDKKTLPRFLSRLTWIDFRGGLDDAEAFRRLVAGIRGLAPGRNNAATRQKAARISNLPFSRNEFFTGRQDILKDLHTGFASGQAVQALSGLGGIGKTQTALEYAYRYEEHYQYLLWAKAHTQESLLTDYATIAVLLNLPEKDAQDQSQTVVAVKQWLECHNDWLLTLDNADDLPMVREFIPVRKTGHILLTTRARNTKPLAVQRTIEKMSPSEGAFFLLSRLGEIKEGAPIESVSEEVRRQAEELSKDLDGLPLALDQAAAFIEEMPSTLKEYRTLYQRARNELLTRRGTLANDHPSVTVTFSLAFKKVEEANAAAADLLRVCAFLEADSIPEEIFSEGAEELGEALGAIVENPLRLRDAIAEAGRYSLLQRNPEVQTVSLHRLVQSVIRDEMEAATQRGWAERAVRAVSSVFPYVEYFAWPVCDRLISHAITLAGAIKEYGIEFPEASLLLNRAGYYLYERAQYEQAEPLWKRAIAIREEVFGAEHPDTATSLNNLAGLYDSQGRYERAEPLYERALAIQEKALGAECIFWTIVNGHSVST